MPTTTRRARTPSRSASPAPPRQLLPCTFDRWKSVADVGGISAAGADGKGASPLIEELGTDLANVRRPARAPARCLAPPS